MIKNKNVEEPDMDLEFSTFSNCDCTGLIPSEINSEDELINYDEMYRFLPPDFRDEEDFY